MQIAAAAALSTVALAVAPAAQAAQEAFMVAEVGAFPLPLNPDLTESQSGLMQFELLMHAGRALHRPGWLGCPLRHVLLLSVAGGLGPLWTLSSW